MFVLLAVALQSQTEGDSQIVSCSVMSGIWAVPAVMHHSSDESQGESPHSNDAVKHQLSALVQL